LLTISKALSSAQAQTYHAKEFTSAEQNYWKQDGAVVGEWQGKLAEQFALAGAVDAQHFARLSEGQNPITGEQLVVIAAGNPIPPQTEPPSSQSSTGPVGMRRSPLPNPFR
jgi:hypothetical protein